MSDTNALWDLPHLQAHLRYAADLEFWTIPFYWTARASLPPGPMRDLVWTVAQQEMFHFQCACNIANAFNAFPDGYKFPMPQYAGKSIPHLNFALDDPDPTKKPIEIDGKAYDFTDFSAELGPADKARINGMCLVELPNWNPLGNNEKQEDIESYGSIGHFYAALLDGISQHVDKIKGGQKQQDHFSWDFQGFSNTITEDGKAGFEQVVDLINAITEQGEGRASDDPNIEKKYQPSVSLHPEDAHFEKFLELYEDNPPVNQPTKEIMPAIQPALQAFLDELSEVFVKGGTFSHEEMDDLGMAIDDCFPNLGPNPGTDPKNCSIPDSVSYATHIKPLFTTIDAGHMSPMGVRLWDAGWMTVPDNAQVVYSRLTATDYRQMPPRAAWCHECLALYEAWMEGGYQP